MRGKPPCECTLGGSDFSILFKFSNSSCMLKFCLRGGSRFSERSRLISAALSSHSRCNDSICFSNRFRSELNSTCCRVSSRSFASTTLCRAAMVDSALAALLKPSYFPLSCSFEMPSSFDWYTALFFCSSLTASWALRRSRAQPSASVFCTAVSRLASSTAATSLAFSWAKASRILISCALWLLFADAAAMLAWFSASCARAALCLASSRSLVKACTSAVSCATSFCRSRACTPERLRLFVKPSASVVFAFNRSLQWPRSACSLASVFSSALHLCSAASRSFARPSCSSRSFSPSTRLRTACHSFIRSTSFMHLLSSDLNCVDSSKDLSACRMKCSLSARV
mmetsp:Transcript_7286/g.19522  ORF Transcript_7286/g.19522 Transcript_7286/m.19522 type:complete len:341 (+) Transcript_7286:576-1598(+)